MTLSAQNLACGYAGTAIIRDVHFDLGPGRIVSILGPNGVGKTTLFKTILGFLPPLAGTCLLDGQPLTHMKRPEIARRIAYVPQKQDVPFAYTVEDAVLMGRAPHLRLLEQPKPEDHHIAREALRSMGIEHLASKPCTSISGGELQMVTIARALAQQPKYLVMDEPTASLDFGNQTHVIERILELAASGIGILLTTHDPGQAFALNSDVVLLQRNQKTLSGSCHQILTEKILSETYGVEVVVREFEHHQRSLSCCVTIPRTPSEG